MRSIAVLSLFCLLSVSHANPELGEAEEGSEDAPLVEQNPLFQTLMYYPGPKVDPRLTSHAQEEVVVALAEATQNPDAYLSEALKGEREKASKEKSNVCVVCQGLIDARVAIQVGLLNSPDVFSVVYKIGKQESAGNNYLRAMLTIPKMKAKGREYRVILEAKALNEEGASAHNLEEALMGTDYKQYKVIQLRETTENEDLNKLEQEIFDESSDIDLFV